jgi:predicted TIM-barrel fold metal-dependent hydrolase
VISVDSHAHIFETGLRLAPVRRYTPTYNATVGDYLSVLDTHGIGYGVLVQPSFLGTDNSYMIEGLKRHPDRLRGIAVVDPDIGLEELDAMGAAGVVGIRLNLAGLPLPDLMTRDWKRVLAHVKRLDWQVEIHRQGRDLPFLVDPLLDAGVNIVIDNVGCPDKDADLTTLASRYLFDRAKSRRIWVKLAGAYRNWPDWDDQSQATEAVNVLLGELGAERLVWGSDWPHTQNESKVQYASTRKNLDKWVPNAGDRKVILQDTPIRLFRFNCPIGV